MDETNIWRRLQNIDPRILYVAVVIVIALPLLFPYTIPGIPLQPTVEAYNTVEGVARAKPNGLVLIASDWSASTRGENHWQDVIAIRHLMKRHLKFAVLSLDPQNRSLVTADIATANADTHADYVYGRDYCLWGYKPSTALPQFLKGLVANVPGTVVADYRGTPVQQIPCMKGVQTMQDISMILLVTPTSLLDNFLQFVASAHVPLIYFPTAVMAPEGYPYLDSHQIAGMVTGVKGAGDYEQLMGVSGFGRKISTALSLVYFLILLLILIGNIGYYVERYQQRAGRTPAQ
jgi:hypothetical protein